MSYRFVNYSLVEFDIKEATAYYKKINPELAKQLLLRIREAKAYIASNPVGFQIKYSKVRTLLLKQFPYHIHYLIDEPNNRIVIIAFINAYKNPLDYTHRE